MRSSFPGNITYSVPKSHLGNVRKDKVKTYSFYRFPKLEYKHSTRKCPKMSWFLCLYFDIFNLEYNILRT